MKIGIGFIAGLVCLWLQAGCVGPGTGSKNISTPSPQLLVTETNVSTNPYDALLYQTIANKWDAMLATHHFALKPATAVVQFDLHSDGMISREKLLSYKGSELLAYVGEEAIAEAAPFQPWPPDMIRMVGGKDKSRSITFTFDYK